MLLIVCIAALAVFDTTYAVRQDRRGSTADVTGGPPRCPGDNEHFEDCGSSCTVTCSNRNDPPVACTDDCVPGCRCDDGYVRNKGKCVQPRDCPSPRKNKVKSRGPAGPYCRGKNEHPENCGSSCTVTCDNMNDPPVACTDQCVPGCRCNDGYVRNGNGDCVKTDDCPRAFKATACGNNEVYTNCTSYCPVTCDSLTGASPPSCATGCKGKGCECVRGTVRNKQGDCVDPSECPNYNPCPRPNEHYEDCGSSCTVTCRNMNDPPVACTDQCVSGCRCNDGYVRNGDGICVNPDDCPRARTQKAQNGGPGGPYCRGNNEHPENCGGSCTVTCDNMNDPPVACTDPCLSGCRCDDGYVRNSNGKCIRPGNCP